MVFWQLTIDANDPRALSAFWADALGYTPAPPAGPETWQAHYRDGLGDEPAYPNRLFDPRGAGPALFFQRVPESKAGKNRLHIDIYPTGRDDRMPQEIRIEVVDGVVDRLVGLGARVHERFRSDDPQDSYYFVVMNDPEGNEFCVS